VTDPTHCEVSVLTYAVLDEVADIKPETWEQVIRASLSDKKGKAMFIGTPKGRNWFYDLYNLGQEETDEIGNRGISPPKTTLL
jgi:hypothetical protein